jgi:serine/threonine protein kinase
MDIGPWTTTSKLGKGGNAVVYLASRSADEGDVALKVINTAKAGREPYQRFVREIEFLRSLKDATGVLPVIDAYLPERGRRPRTARGSPCRSRGRSPRHWTASRSRRL